MSETPSTVEQPSASSDHNKHHADLRREITDAFKQLQNLVRASLRPIPTQTGDGSYVTENPPGTGVLSDLEHMKPEDYIAITQAIADDINSHHIIDDRKYPMEKVIKLAAELPKSSENGKKMTNSLLVQLWNDLQHPPRAFLGEQYMYRQADGSNNNILFPHIGAAGTPYARSVPPLTVQPSSRPDAGVLFDSLMARKSFIPHPNKISSVLFYVASIIIHDCFRTNYRDQQINDTSSYLDLSPLYGADSKEQNQMRTFRDGKIKPDCFASRRVLGFPPGVGVMLIMFGRFHNYVVDNLKSIDENQRFSQLIRQNIEKYDEALFQTGRLITCGLYVNIILKDYVGTILGLNHTSSSWSLDPRLNTDRVGSKPDVTKGGGNVVSAEFNLIYRWHSCISDKDARWSENNYERQFPGQDLSRLSAEELVRLLGQWESSLSENPMNRPFAGLSRGPNGSYSDDGLARIWIESVEDRAGAFGAYNVPNILRLVEILGIEQARAWNLCTLNEFRKYFNLVPYETFESINPDPTVSKQLKRLYDHPDLVELYPGLVVEAAKETMEPGSNLCANYTLSRAILSDAAGLIRSDRFYTDDYNPKNLTNWGHAEVNFDETVDNGCVLYKLVLRALPYNFRPESVYAHFPLTIPSENQKILRALGKDNEYNWDKPASLPRPIIITSQSACQEILTNQRCFRLTWGKNIELLVEQNGKCYGRDFMLAGDRPANSESREKFRPCMYHKHWESQIRRFYEETTLDLLRQHSYPVGGVNQVDIVRDVINLAHTRFAAALFAFPLKSEGNPHGLYTESELYALLALDFACIFYDIDPVKSFSLHRASRTLSQQLGKIVEMQVEAIAHNGGLASFLGKFHKHDDKPSLPGYGVQMISSLLKQDIKPKDLVWTHMLPFFGSSVANQGQLLSQCLDYYLSEEGSVHLPTIRRLATLNTADGDDKLLHYLLEGCRLSNTVGMFRDVAEPYDLQDNDKNIHVKEGDWVICNLMTASTDAAAFPEPRKVVLDRPVDSYVHYGLGPHQCIGKEWSKVALTTMFKVIGRLDNLRRAPGPKGLLKTVAQPNGFKAYMTPDESSFSPFPTTMKVQWDTSG
ncbi:MAG: hypothetical protein Q9227_007197 [Pyrenula ochraceoflavens]